MYSSPDFGRAIFLSLKLHCTLPKNNIVENHPLN